MEGVTIGGIISKQTVVYTIYANVGVPDCDIVCKQTVRSGGDYSIGVSSNRFTPKNAAVGTNIYRICKSTIERDYILDQGVLTKAEAESLNLAISHDDSARGRPRMAHTLGTVGLPPIENPLRSIVVLLTLTTIALVLSGGVRLLFSI
jgi:hypothetical protein